MMDILKIMQPPSNSSEGFKPFDGQVNQAIFSTELDFKVRRFEVSLESEISTIKDKLEMMEHLSNVNCSISTESVKPVMALVYGVARGTDIDPLNDIIGGNLNERIASLSTESEFLSTESISDRIADMAASLIERIKRMGTFLREVLLSLVNHFSDLDKRLDSIESDYHRLKDVKLVFKPEIRMTENQIKTILFNGDAVGGFGRDLQRLTEYNRSAAIFKFADNLEALLKGRGTRDIKELKYEDIVDVMSSYMDELSKVLGMEKKEYKDPETGESSLKFSSSNFMGNVALTMTYPLATRTASRLSIVIKSEFPDKEKLNGKVEIIDIKDIPQITRLVRAFVEPNKYNIEKANKIIKTIEDMTSSLTEDLNAEKTKLVRETILNLSKLASELPTKLTSIAVKCIDSYLRYCELSLKAIEKQ